MDNVLTIKVGKELDLIIADKIFGIKKVHYSEWDTEKQAPEYIPSGKPWRTHHIDARPIPPFSTNINGAWVVFEKTDFDVIWRIVNPDKIEYAVGYVRGKDNDLICYSKSIEIEDCLSPICSTVPEAICKSALLRIKGVLNID